ncbi:hypothetical protein MTR67_049584, partial [Solanum verrucosum]
GWRKYLEGRWFLARDYWSVIGAQNQNQNTKLCLPEYKFGAQDTSILELSMKVKVNNIWTVEVRTSQWLF